MPTLIVHQGTEHISVQFDGVQPLSRVLAAEGYAVPQPCGGRGICRKCVAISLCGAVSEPTPSEKNAQERLICQVTLLGDAEVTLAPPQAWIGIETAHADVLLGIPMPGRYGAAIDLGTTTIAATVYDLRLGIAVGEGACLNPQTEIAADVLGRIGAAISGKQERMRDLAQQGIHRALLLACAQGGVERVTSMTVAGNTAMLYLLTGRAPDSLAFAPFQADALFGGEAMLPDGLAYLPPCAAAFVGADLTCAALSLGLCEQTDTTLLMDIGTNGELMLWHQGKLFAASAPAGPAFEGGEISQGCGGVLGAIDQVWVEGGRVGCHVLGGGEAIGICGSGIIDAVAVLLQLGLVDSTGAMETPRYSLRDGIALTAGDIRAVQLAKAAIAAATDSLLEAAGVTYADVRRVWLAGGFGSHVRVASAAAIGLLPLSLTPRTTVAGNAALNGAAMLLLNVPLRGKAEQIARTVRVIPLGGDAGFEARFLHAMDFPITDA